MALHDTLIYCPATNNSQAGIIDMRCLDCQEPYTNASGHYTTMIGGAPTLGKLEVENSHTGADIQLTEGDLINDWLPLPAEFARELADSDVLTVDMIDTSRPRSESYTLRCRRITGAFGKYGIALHTVPWPLEIGAGQRIELSAQRGSRRIGVYFSTI